MADVKITWLLELLLFRITVNVAFEFSLLVFNSFVVRVLLHILVCVLCSLHQLAQSGGFVAGGLACLAKRFFSVCNKIVP